jgi:hypothetical protein
METWLSVKVYVVCGLQSVYFIIRMLEYLQFIWWSRCMLNDINAYLLSSICDHKHGYSSIQVCYLRLKTSVEFLKHLQFVLAT